MEPEWGRGSRGAGSRARSEGGNRKNFARGANSGAAAAQGVWTDEEDRIMEKRHGEVGVCVISAGD